MADTDGIDTLSSKGYTDVLHGIEEHPTIPQTPREKASPDEFRTPQESHDEIRPTDCAGTAPTTPSVEHLAKVLFDTPSGTTTEGRDKVSAPTENVSTPPMNRSQPQPAPSPRAINLAQGMKQNEPSFEDGYDSDGEIGPHSFVVEEEGVQDYEEDDLPSAPPVAQPPVLVAVGVPENPNEVPLRQHVPITEEALVAMKRADLAVELRKHGQSVGGAKGVLLE
jgi:hypothetical protein